MTNRRVFTEPELLVIAGDAFEQHFRRKPAVCMADGRWLEGYLACLADAMPDIERRYEALSKGSSHEPRGNDRL